MGGKKQAMNVVEQCPKVLSSADISAVSTSGLCSTRQIYSFLIAKKPSPVPQIHGAHTNMRLELSWMVQHLS
jgi:hypothetical protein